MMLNYNNCDKDTSFSKYVVCYLNNDVVPANFLTLNEKKSERACNLCFLVQQA